MKVKELSSRIEKFRDELGEHAQLWMSSLDRTLPDYPIASGAKLREQSANLARQLGMLRPYLDRFEFPIMIGVGGVMWDMFDSSVSNDVAIRKGRSIEEALQHLQKVLGRLDSMSPDDEFQLHARIEQQPHTVPQQVTVYNLQGAQSRVNIQSNDHSTNLSSVTEQQLFAGIRHALEQGVPDSSERHAILAKLDELEAAKHGSNFLSKYQAFINTVAAHVAIIAPFLPALSQMLGR